MSTQWEDVTTVIKNAATRLALDKPDKPLISSNQFSLFDSMSAAELMDAKMDQCFGFVEELNKLTASSLYSITLPALRSAEEVDNAFEALYPVLLRLLLNEISVINGASILESTHHCILMWPAAWKTLSDIVVDNDEQRLLVQVLQFFGKSAVKSLACFHSAVLAADIYEDEDFSPSFRQFLTQCEIDTQDLQALFVEVGSALTALGSTSALKLSALLAVQQAFLRFSEVFDGHVVSTIVMSNRVLKHAKQERQTSSTADALADVTRGVCQENMSALLATRATELSAAVSTLESQQKSLSFVPDADCELRLFRPYLARLHLVGPLRCTVPLCVTSQLQSLSQLCRHILAALSFTRSLPNHLQTVLDAGDALAKQPLHSFSFEQILQQLMDVSLRDFHLFARCVLMAENHVIAVDLARYLINSMLMRGVPRSILETDITFDWICGNLSMAAWESLKVMTICRGRIAVRLEQLLTLWGNVSIDSMYVDEQLRAEFGLGHSPPGHQQQAPSQQWLSNWTVTQSTRLMQLCFDLMLEMDVTNPVEYDSLFWYADYVAATQGHAMDKLRSMNYQMESLLFEERKLEYIQQMSTKKNKKKTNHGKTVEEPQPPSALVPFAEDYIARGRGQIARGLFRMFIILKQLGAMKRHSNRYTSTERIFQRRFRPCADVFNPAPLTYKEFVNTINRDSTAPVTESASSVAAEEMDIQPMNDLHAVLKSAIVCFQNARKYFDESKKIPTLNTNYPLLDENAAPSLTAMIKVSVASLLAANKLLKLLTDTPDAKFTVKFNSSYDVRYPVFEIVI